MVLRRDQTLSSLSIEPSSRLCLLSQTSTTTDSRIAMSISKWDHTRTGMDQVLTFTRDMQVTRLNLVSSALVN